MPGKALIKESDVLDAARKGASTLVVGTNALITPLARDAARQHGITFSPASPVSSELPRHKSSGRIVVIGSDHGGYPWKSALGDLISGLDWQVVDVGTDSEKSCDYPDFAYAVARMVSSGRARFGIMIDGAGIGSCMVCNKVDGVRAACCYNEFTAWNARAHNDANVLTLGSRTLGIEVAKRIVEQFLTARFEGGRHETRVAKISDLDDRFTRSR